MSTSLSLRKLLEQLERLRFEEPPSPPPPPLPPPTPHPCRRPVITHTNDQFILDPKPILLTSSYWILGYTRMTGPDVWACVYQISGIGPWMCKSFHCSHCREGDLNNITNGANVDKLLVLCKLTTPYHNVVFKQVLQTQLANQYTRVLSPTPSYQYMYSHYTDKTVSRICYLHNGNPHTWKDHLCIERGPSISDTEYTLYRWYNKVNKTCLHVWVSPNQRGTLHWQRNNTPFKCRDVTCYQKAQ